MNFCLKNFYNLIKCFIKLKMSDLKIDDNIANILVDNISFFAYIDPNVITILGLILNVVILKMLYSNEINITLLIILMMRYLSDCLDGCVARKYNKQSYIGGILDTISDIMLMIIMSYFVAIKFNIPIQIYISIIVIGLILISTQYDIFNTHTEIKKINNNILDIIPFLTNNTILVFIIFFMIKNYL